MIYTPKEKARREEEREQRAWVRSFHKMFAVFPKMCRCCGREFYLDWGWKHFARGLYDDGWDYVCKVCGPTREAASIEYDKMTSPWKYNISSEEYMEKYLHIK